MFRNTLCILLCKHIHFNIQEGSLLCGISEANEYARMTMHKENFTFHHSDPVICLWKSYQKNGKIQKRKRIQELQIEIATSPDSETIFPHDIESQNLVIQEINSSLEEVNKNIEKYNGIVDSLSSIRNDQLPITKYGLWIINHQASSINYELSNAN